MSTAARLIILVLMCVGCRPHPEPSHEPAPEPMPEIVLSEDEQRELVGVLARAAASGGAECTCVQRRAFEGRVAALLVELEGVLEEPSGLTPRDFVVAPSDAFDTLAGLWFARHHTPEMLAVEGRIFRGMGLVHAKLDYAEALRGEALKELFAFYDEEEQVVYVRHPRIDRPELRSAMFLATVHAMLDRKYGLAASLFDVPEGDERLARFAVFQGAAMHVWQRLYEGISLSQIEAAALDAITFQPLFLKRLAIFPHIEGARYIEAVGWDTALAQPVDNTLSILTRESVASRSVTALIPMRELGNFEPAEPEYEGTLGVFALRAWLELVGHREDADALTAGWRGDHLWSFKRGEKNMLLLHVSVWSDEASALAFHDAVQALFKQRYHRKRNYFSEALVEDDVVIWLEGLVGEDATQDRALERMMRSVVLDGQPRLDAPVE